MALLIASSRIRQGIYSLKVCISRLLYIRIVCLWTELASTMVLINVLWSICGREASNQIQYSKTSVLIALIAVLMSNLKQCLRYL